MDLEPELGLFYHGLCGLHPARVWDGSVWPVSDAARANAKASHMIASMTWMQQTMLAEPDPQLIDQMHNLIDNIEEAAHATAIQSVDTIKSEVLRLKFELKKIREDFRTTGLDLKVDNIERRLNLWTSILNDKRIVSRGKEQSELLYKVKSEVDNLGFSLNALSIEFLTAEQEYKKTMSAGLTWGEQAKRLQELNEEINRLKDRHEEVNVSIASLPKLVLREVKKAQDEQVLTTVVHNDDEPDPSKLDELEKQIECLKQDLETKDQINDTLRQESASLKKQVECLHQTYSNIQTPCISKVLTPALLSSIDSLAENASASEILSLIESMYPDRVRMLKSAYDTAGEHGPSISSSVLYPRLKAMVTDGLNILRETGRMIDMRNVVPGELAVQESHTVRSSTRLRNKRTFQDGPKKRVVYPHLTLEYGTRLYFDYDQEEDRLVIAYLGKHLPSAKSATI